MLISENGVGGVMLRCYTITDSKVDLVDVDAIHDPENIVWIDVFSPTKQDEQRIESLLNINIPTKDEMHEIEFSSRLYHRGETLYATTIFVTQSETISPESHAITFILNRNYLVSVRYVDVAPFNNFLKWLPSFMPSRVQGNTILAGMLEFLIDQMADMLENSGRKIDEITKEIFQNNHPNSESKKTAPNFKNILSLIGLIGDLLSKSRESFLTISRMLGYLLSSDYYNQLPSDQKRVEMMLRDMASLSDHASFLSNKVNFLLDATLGMVNIEQNRIIKIFSVVAVMLLPPTMIASIYGMNFKNMPELDWTFGYPLAIFIMAMSGFLPYKYFKKKGWL